MTDSNNLAQDGLTKLQRQIERVNARCNVILGGALVAIASGVLLWAPVAMSEPEQPVDGTGYDDLYQFSANTPAVAAEVNSNFAVLRGLAADLQASKLDKAGGAVAGNLDVNGTLDVGSTTGVAIKLHNDADISGVDVIQGHNDLRLRGDSEGGDDLVIDGNGTVRVKKNLNVDSTVTGLTLYDCSWTSCIDTPSNGNLTCPAQSPGRPVLAGIDLAIHDNQKPAGCGGASHEDEIRLFCCRIGGPGNTP